MLAKLVVIFNCFKLPFFQPDCWGLHKPSYNIFTLIDTVFHGQFGQIRVKKRKHREKECLLNKPEACSPQKESRCTQSLAAKQRDKKSRHNTNTVRLLTTQYFYYKIQLTVNKSTVVDSSHQIPPCDWKINKNFSWLETLEVVGLHG